MDELNSTNATDTGNSSVTINDWSGTITAVDVTIFTLLTLKVWVLLSFMIYGTRTNRWRNRPGNSSLSSGTSYILCTISIITTIPFSAMVAAVNQHSHFDEDTDMCKTLADGAAITYFISIDTTYLFLWFMQRQTCKHPYVRERVNKRMNIFSWAYAIVLTLSFIAVIVIYVSFVDYKSMGGVCVYDLAQSRKPLVSVLGSIPIFALQIELVWVSIYTAVRARFPSGDNERNSTVISVKNNWRIFYR